VRAGAPPGFARTPGRETTTPWPSLDANLMSAKVLLRHPDELSAPTRRYGRPFRRQQVSSTSTNWLREAYG
jgi:hypothetical protein